MFLKILSYLAFSFLFSFFSIDSVRARQSKLPACPDYISTNKYNNCVGTWSTDNGYTYFGEWQNGTPNGQGTSTYANGGNYVGQFKDDKPNGPGIVYAPDGSIIAQGIYEKGNLTNR